MIAEKVQYMEKTSYGEIADKDSEIATEKHRFSPPKPMLYGL